MRVWTTVLAATTCAAVLAFAAVGSATPGERGSSEIARACAAEKKADMGAFRLKYGRHAMRHCIRGELAPTDPVLPEVVPPNPALTCAEQRDLDEPAFTEQWGTNGNGKNAYGNCVSATAQSSPHGNGHGPPA